MRLIWINVALFLSFPLALMGQNTPLELLDKASFKQLKRGNQDLAVFEMRSETTKKIIQSPDNSFELELPLSNNEVISVRMDEFYPFSQNFKLLDEKGKIFPFEHPKYFKGEVLSKQGGKVYLTLREGRLSGLVSIPDRADLQIVPLAQANTVGIYASPKRKKEQQFHCLTADPQNTLKPIDSYPNRSVDNCVNVYLEADFFMYQDYGSMTAVMDYLADVWVPVAALYDAETITINIEEVLVWTTNDPYSNVDAGLALQEFQAFRPTYNGDIAHLVSTNPANIGGIAFIDVLCTTVAYGFSNITNFFSELPNYSWTVNVLAHEIGHNLGSPHTHSCTWPNGPIDDCSAPDGNCNPGPTPANGGTIMSYCHLNGTGIDFNNGFGALPGDLIRDRITNASCLQTCNTSTSNSPPTADFTYQVTNPCWVGGASFSSSSTGNPVSYLWEFEGASPNSSTEMNPSTQYVIPGVYNVSLTVTNAFGSDTKVRQNIINIQDVPDLSYNFQLLNGVDFFQFTGISSSATDWSWNFGDGTSSTAQNPQHTFANSGTYTVVLSASNFCGTETTDFTVDVNVGDAPTANFGANGVTGCAPLVVNFLDQSSNNPTSWNWDLTGASPSSSNSMSPSTTYNVPGLYPVELEVVNSFGSDTEIKLNYVTVQSVPLVDFSFQVNGPSAAFTNLSSNYDSVLWDFGDGTTSTQFNPTHAFATNGLYQVTLIGSNECGMEQMTKSVSYNVLPEPGFTVQAFESCAPFVANFSDVSLNSTTVSWQFPGGSPGVSNSSNPSVSYQNPGTYNVLMMVSNGSQNVTKVFQDVLIINEEPNAIFNTSINGNEVSFIDQSLYGGEYVWDFGDGNQSTEVDPLHSYTFEGSYPVTQTVSNICGSDTHTEIVEIYTDPQGFIAPGQTNYCTGEEITFETNITGTVGSYLWEIIGTQTLTSTEADPSFYITVPGIYSVRLTLTNPAGIEEIFLQNYLNVEAVPIPDFSFQIDVLQVSFQNNSTAGDQYIWDFGDGATSAQDSPIHHYTQIGTYQVSLDVSNECRTERITRTIVIDQTTTAAFDTDNREICAGDQVQFNNLSTSGAVTFEWEFPGGIPSVSNDLNPLIRYNEPGDYDVKLTVSDGSDQDEINLQDYISVEVTNPFVLSQEYISSTIIRFNSQEAWPGNYTWNWGDGTTSSVSSPVHIFPEEGSYDVQVDFSNNCVSFDTSFTLDLYNPVQSEFSVAATEICRQNYLSIDNLSSNNATHWEWLAPGSYEEESTDKDPIFSYLEAGEYFIQLVAHNASYSDTFKIESIRVLDQPTADFDYQLNGSSVNFINESIDGQSYEWKFGDGDLTSLPGPTHQYNSEGSFEVELITHNFCGEDIVRKEIEFYTKPTADFNLISTEDCIPFFVGISNNSSENSASFEWILEGPQSESFSVANPFISIDEEGSYDLTLIVANPLFSDTIKKNNLILAKDKPSVISDYTQQGFTFDFIDQSQDLTSVLWEFGDGAQSSSTSPKHEYGQAGLYEVKHAAVNECGSDTEIFFVEAKEAPQASFGVFQQKRCVGDTFNFVGVSNNLITGYQWFFDGAAVEFANEKDPMAVYYAPGSYDIQLITQSDIGADTVVYFNYIVVEDNPVASFEMNSVGTQIITENNSLNSTEFIWQSEGHISMDIDPVFTYDSNGVYRVELYAFNSCGLDSLSFQTSITALPEAHFSYKDQACINEEIYLTSQSTGAFNHTWIVNDSIVVNSSDSLSVSFSEPGIYDLGLVVENFWGVDTSYIFDAIEVIPLPNSNFTFEFFDNQVLFSNLSENAENYQWDYGDGNQSDHGGEQFHLFADAGIYEVRLIAFNECGSDTLTRVVDANILLPEILFFSNQDECVPTSFEVSEQSSGNPTNWFWELKGPDTLISFARSPAWELVTPGTYDLYVEISNTYGTESKFFPELVTVKGPPSAEFSYELLDGNISISANDTIPLQSHWDFGDGQSSFDSIGVHSYNSSDEYLITHTSSNVCGENSMSQSIEVLITNPYPRDVLEEVSISPNPSNSEAVLDLRGYVDRDFDINIYQSNGKLVHKICQEPLSGNRRITLPIDLLDSGVYLVTISSNRPLKTLRWVKY